MKLLRIITGLTAICLFTVNISAEYVFPEAVEKEIQRRIDAEKYTGLAIGICDSTGVHYYFYGKQRLESDDLPNASTIYEIGSITKTFTAILLADQCQKTAMTLNDPIKMYLPEGSKVPTRNGKEITLKHLVTHTSGLPRMPNNFAPVDPTNPYADYSTKQMLEFLSTCKLERDIGEQVSYSNYGMGLLGYILEQATGKDYETLIRERIASPLKMSNTVIQLSAEMKQQLAPGYAFGQQVSNWDIQSMAGAGGLRSSVTDMCRYISANMGVVESALYPIMQETHRSVKALQQPEMEIGLAWHTLTKNGMSVVWHNGGTGGYRSFAGFLKDRSKGVVVLGNSSESVDDIGLHLLSTGFDLHETKPAGSVKLKALLTQYPAEKAIREFKKFKEANQDSFDFSEQRLNLLGYRYMWANEMEKALSIFSLNTELFPDSANVWDSLGEALKTKGDNQKSIAAYTHALKLNPGLESAKKMLNELGVNHEEIVPEVKLSIDVLKQFCGEYELTPDFKVKIWIDGEQLTGQATGQDAFHLYPISATRFYLKIAEAQIEFHLDESEAVSGLTLFQNGQELYGKKLS